jgi:hypothetical protein
MVPPWMAATVHAQSQSQTIPPAYAPPPYGPPPDYSPNAKRPKSMSVLIVELGIVAIVLIMASIAGCLYIQSQ